MPTENLSTFKMALISVANSLVIQQNIKSGHFKSCVHLGSKVLVPKNIFLGVPTCYSSKVSQLATLAQIREYFRSSFMLLPSFHNLLPRDSSTIFGVISSHFYLMNDATTTIGNLRPFIILPICHCRHIIQYYFYYDVSKSQSVHQCNCCKQPTAAQSLLLIAHKISNVDIWVVGEI